MAKLLTVFFLLSFSLTNAQIYDQDVLQKSINTPTFTFKPQFIVGIVGSKRTISNPEKYYLKITQDSIVCHLPTPKQRMKPGAVKRKSDGTPDVSAIKWEETFALKGFQYKVAEMKKNEWQLQIIPQDNKHIHQIRLNVLQGGSATLSISNSDYEPITYAGWITSETSKNAKKPRNKKR